MSLWTRLIESAGSDAGGNGRLTHESADTPAALVTERPDMPLVYDTDADAPHLAAPDVHELRTPDVTVTKPRHASGWAVWRVQLPGDGQARQIAGKHLGRTSLIVRNLEVAGGSDIEVGPRDSVTVGTAWPVPAAYQVSFEHTAEVWAVSAAAVAVAVLAEYDYDTGGS